MKNHPQSPAQRPGGFAHQPAVAFAVHQREADLMQFAL
jgi:hypothetical protein